MRSASRMITLGAMKPIVEDRTRETREEVAARQTRAIAGLVTKGATEMCGGDTDLTLLLLATALGQLAAQTGTDLETLIGRVRHERDVAMAQAEEQSILWKQHADA